MTSYTLDLPHFCGEYHGYSPQTDLFAAKLQLICPLRRLELQNSKGIRLEGHKINCFTQSFQVIKFGASKMEITISIGKKWGHAEPVEARGRRPLRASLRQAQTDDPLCFLQLVMGSGKIPADSESEMTYLCAKLHSVADRVIVLIACRVVWFRRIESESMVRSCLQRFVRWVACHFF